MQLTVFSTDDRKSGFRLQYMEIYNWGTFDEHVWKINPGGETSLLTGANGSGKTTFVDALLTLIVPEKKYRFYNQSSGSDKKGDRTEETYLLGGYGTVATDSGQGTKTLYLRENRETAYSILLAHFANEAEQLVTLFQVRYFSGNEMKRVFAVAHRALHIEDDFKPFDFNGGWRKRIDQQYNKGSRKQVEWFDSSSRYAQRLVEVLGMQSIQALGLFNQTVGIKVLGELNSFIRQHMLEPRNMEDQFQDLKKHLGTLLDAQRNIEKVEEQIRLLQPLKKSYAQYKEQAEKLGQTRLELETARVWNVYTTHHLLDNAIGQGRKQLQELQQQLGLVRTDINRLLEEERQTQNQLDKNKAGQRLLQLEKEQETLQQQLAATESALAAFTEWCQAVHIDDTPATEADYIRIRKETERMDKKIKTEIRNNEEERWEAQDLLKRTQEQKTRLEEEFNLLQQSKNNIPGHLVQLRREICQALKLDTGDLPFAGELMQVRAAEQEWQPALEKLLRGFGIRLLVPHKHYRKVNKYVNQTNLRARLVYEQVQEVALLKHAEEGTVYHKLEFHPDHPLSSWVAQQVILYMDYNCVDNEKTLERFDKAITVHGLIRNRGRHEKDDRPERNDPGKYVMGWNNEQKREALQNQRLRLLAALEQGEEALQRAEGKGKRLQKQVYAVTRLQEHSGFHLVDTNGVQRAIHKMEEQAKELKGSSNQLKSVTKQLDTILEQRQQQEWQRDELVGQLKVAETQLKEMEAQQQQLEPLLLALTAEDKEQLLVFQQKHSSRLAEVTLLTIRDLFAQLKDHTEEQARKLEEAVIREGRELDKSIHRIKNPPMEILQRFTDWAADVQPLSGDREYANEYLDWLDKLETDNLPRYKKDFERYLHDTMVYKMGELNEELDGWEQKIRNSINTLNQSLAGINFNRLPDTYIQLGIKSVTDTTVKEFRSKLLSALPQTSSWQQSSFEDKAAHFRKQVQPLVASLEESEAYRARVLDVRNWFEFWADEKYRNTDELKKTYRQMGQLSGGEKAQLTYTILCSAIAYQFGITREGRNARSLRFIAVDESFSNQDEEKATYLMELCKQLHLQLLVVTPSDKIQIVEDFIAHVHLVQRVNNRHSILFNMTKKELKARKGKSLTA
ncbi:MAG: SbcC/MukB-like Walker B domain-containing protein [Candidatus Pseudobacter hemicellulosilyticus]|uniref:SbcC/MukB-like Walker B domain-containing protein n=1 Tax=Candidatus Pseudobacter hemicellulosilyticus TaxID=3121375 RepID=A0AAJ5WP50_9BACT|nr:MAG: SbcC/MukB-like Walker B domain-containing protein [Pseudobacter sp.]